MYLVGSVLRSARGRNARRGECVETRQSLRVATCEYMTPVREYLGRVRQEKNDVPRWQYSVKREYFIEATFCEYNIELSRRRCSAKCEDGSSRQCSAKYDVVFTRRQCSAKRED